jgi:HlyD family secretion protein
MEEKSMLIKKVFLFLLVAGVALAGAGCGGGRNAIATPTPLPKIASYEPTIFTVERGPIVSEKSIIAEVVPARQDEIFFRASGYVTRVIVKDGTSVKTGDLLAELQVEDLLNALQQAEIDLDVAQTNLAKYQSDRQYSIARAELDLQIWEERVKLAELDLESAFSQNAIARAESNLAIVKASYELSKLSLQQAKEDISSYEEQAVQRTQISVDRLKAQIAERQIVAPYDAIVLRSRLREGNSTEAFQSVITVGDPTQLVIRIPLDRELRDVLNKNSEIRMYLTTDAEESYPVQYLPNFLPISSKETTLSATEFMYFNLPEQFQADQTLLGKTVKIVAVLGRNDDALLLPPGAIREYRGLTFVIVLEGDKRRRVEIYEIGLKTADRWEVLGDLVEGEQVLGP